MSDQINARKLDHLKALETDEGVERHGAEFDRIKLIHRGLPELDFDAVDTSTRFLGKTLTAPLLISSMTGGDGDEILQINQRLAEAAEHCGVAMAVGSQRVMFTNAQAAQSFALRKFAPNALLLANLGAVQLNMGFDTAQCQKAVEQLEADGLYLHLNPLQEAIQPEGDLKFGGLAARLREVVDVLSVPVLLKEVGCGLSPKDIELGLGAGICHFDLAGRGGTSWSRIEYHRRTREEDDLGLVFQDWGMSTVDALKAAAPYHTQAQFIASGGIRNGIDMAKAIILGARVCGMAAPFLPAAKVSTEAVIAQIEAYKREFKTAMFLLGCADVTALYKNTTLMLSRGEE